MKKLLITGYKIFSVITIVSFIVSPLSVLAVDSGSLEPSATGEVVVPAAPSDSGPTSDSVTAPDTAPSSESSATTSPTATFELLPSGTPQESIPENTDTPPAENPPANLLDSIKAIPIKSTEFK